MPITGTLYDIGPSRNIDPLWEHIVWKKGFTHLIYEIMSPNLLENDMDLGRTQYARAKKN